MIAETMDHFEEITQVDLQAAKPMIELVNERTEKPTVRMKPLRCGKCARIGTNEAGPATHSPSCPNKE